MKTPILAAAILAVAAPAFASDASLARSLGVQPGAYTQEQLATLKAHEGDSAGESRVYFGGDAANGVVNDVAAAKFRELNAEQNNGVSATSQAVAARGIINPVAEAKFQELRAE
ncbi:hypothetical protein [Vannielia litorea]|uniref:hypothetical protein n=1 Tax=Vannielia litorea TaxID=1217970 RepID=UPI001C9638F5|nr:hypothetical protein [Vannielia litorea]MBY6048864.1 hypothetical protein [Vannielia litorea]MBY6076278.1 hypothetical protein [Vannielia litorea]